MHLWGLEACQHNLILWGGLNSPSSPPEREREKVSIPSPGQSLKPFCERILGNLGRLFMTSGVDLNAIHNIARNWASHLEHLQSILLEFDTDGAPEESDLIRLFQENLRPSIKAQMEQTGRELGSWKEMIEKAVDAEAKTGLQPASYIREMDHRCQRGNLPVHVTAAKVQTLGSSMIDPRIEEPRPKAQEPKPLNN